MNKLVNMAKLVGVAFLLIVVIVIVYYIIKVVLAVTLYALIIAIIGGVGFFIYKMFSGKK